MPAPLLANLIDIETVQDKKQRSVSQVTDYHVQEIFNREEHSSITMRRQRKEIKRTEMGRERQRIWREISCEIIFLYLHLYLFNRYLHLYLDFLNVYINLYLYLHFSQSPSLSLFLFCLISNLDESSSPHVYLCQYQYPTITVSISSSTLSPMMYKG